jgi:hypothetical protein
MTRNRNIEWLGEASTVASRRKLKDARAYEFLFPRPKGENITVKRNAGVGNTVKFIPKVVEETLDQTEAIARTLIAPTLRQTCKNIWQWVYDHIRYEKDETGKEQVRSPARLFYDRKGDCDCFTTFIDSVIVNVSHIKRWPVKIVNRITKYGGVGFQHIYPMVITPQGEGIVMDCVTEFFDYEEPFTEKEDHKVMDLEYLNGIDSVDLQKQNHFFDEEADQHESYPYADHAFGELGKLKIFQKKKQNEPDDKSKGKVGNAIKKAVHSVNRVNPATTLLRTGLLASMKLNVMNVAGRLKWTYLTNEAAQKKKLNMERWAKAKKVRERLEKIFYGAGGKPENLRESILTGKGNKGKEVNGLGLVPIYAMGESGMSLRDVIGAELYDKENTNLSGLGEPITAASIAAATAALATLSQLLKQIGPVKDGEDNTENPDASGDSVSPDETAPLPTDDPDVDNSDGNGKSNAKNGDEKSPAFMDDPIGWAKANPGKASIAALGVIAVIYGGYKWYQASKENEEQDLPLKYSSRQSASRAPREDVYHVPLAE